MITLPGAYDMFTLGKLFGLLYILFFGVIGNQPLWIATQIFYLFGGSPSDIPW